MNQTTEIPTLDVIAYRIKHSLKTDPMKLIKTLTDLMNFPSSECTLSTTKSEEDISSGDYAFVILSTAEEDERQYVVYLQKTENGDSKCLGYDPLKAWDSDANLIRN